MLGSPVAQLPWQRCPSEEGTDGARHRFSKGLLLAAELQIAGVTHMANQRKERNRKVHPPAHPELWVHHIGSGITASFDPRRETAQLQGSDLIPQCSRTLSQGPSAHALRTLKEPGDNE